MNTVKISIMMVLALGMTVQVAAMPLKPGISDVVEGAGTLDEYDAERAGDYVDPTPVPAGAEPWGDLNNLRNLAIRSDLVFSGVVVDINYRLSEPSGPERLRVPFTFITYWVNRLVMGQAGGEYITLRFIGGFDERSDSYMTTSVTPEIEVGDEDLLFVVDNNDSICPLVGHSQGRLRVVDERVYSETGREVTLGRGDGMVMGPRHRLPQIMEQRVYTAGGLLTFEKQYGSGLVQSPSNAVSLETLVNHIESFDLQPVDGRCFANADINAFLPGPDMTEASDPDQPHAERALDPEEKSDREFEELEERAVPVEAGK